MIIRIDEHTDNVGAASDSFEPSVGRAAVVQFYLAEKGIEKNRLSSEGYGELQPTVTNDIHEGRAMNRRVEFRIVQD